MFSRMSERGRQRLRTIIIVLATALIIAPAAALAGHQFNDVPDSNVFHDDIEWMRDNGITAGCNPPANDKYCPGDNVTREQMAAFMHRLETENVFLRPGEGSGGDGGDADTVDGKHASDFLGATAKAVDSDKLDGKDSSAFLGATAKATDSDKLDGTDSADFATDAELDALDAFIPITTFAVINGSIVRSDFRAPMTGAPAVSGSAGVFTVDLPGYTFEINSATAATAVCTATIHEVYVIVSQTVGDMLVELYDADGSPSDDLDSENDFTCAVYAAG